MAASSGGPCPHFHSLAAASQRRNPDPVGTFNRAASVHISQRSFSTGMKFFAGLTFLLFLPHIATAQSVNFGIEAGPTLISINYNDPHEIWSTAFRPSYGGMLSAQIRLRSSVSVRSGLRYALLGGRINYEADLEIEERGPNGELISTRTEQLLGQFDIRQSYVSIPLHLVVHPRVLPFEVLVGPEIGYLTSANLENDREKPQTFHEEKDVLNDMDRVNLTATVGVAKSARLGGSALRLLLFYSHGFTGVADDDWLSDWQTREIGLTLGLVL